MVRLIGLMGYAGAGKDTAAEALLARGWTGIAFADALREALLALDPIVDPLSQISTARVSSVVGELGWDRAKREYPEIRRLLQRLGTEVVRNLFAEDFLVDIAEKKIGDGPAVFTDVRFRNEVDMIRRRGGIIVLVDRPGCRPVNGHVSEAWDRSWADHSVLNSSVENLHDEILSLVS